LLREAAVGLAPTQPALPDGGLVIPANVFDATFEGLRARLDKRDGQSGVEKAHGDAAAHRAGADDADSFHATRGFVRPKIGNPGDLAFSEEGIAQGSRLRACPQLQKGGALDRETDVEGLLHSGLHRLDRFLPGDLSAVFRFPRLARSFEYTG